MQQKRVKTRARQREKEWRRHICAQTYVFDKEKDKNGAQGAVRGERKSVRRYERVRQRGCERRKRKKKRKTPKTPTKNAKSSRGGWRV